MPLPPNQIPPTVGNDALFYKLALLAIGVPANEIPAYMSQTTFRRIFLLNVGGGGGGGNVISVSGNIVNNTDATRPIVTQVQSDLNVVDQSQPSFVRNQWQADWNETTTTAKSYIQNKPAPYTLPIATNTVLGGVKIGTGINIATDGTISTSGTGTGTVTSVGLTSTDLTVTGSPVTTNGTITANLATIGTANTYNYATITTDSKGRVSSASSNTPITSITNGTTTITGALTLIAGNNVTITPSGQNITISSTGGTGGVTITSPNSTIAVGGTTTNPTLDLAQQGATTGQVLTYNGTKYAPVSLPNIVNSFKSNTQTARTGNITFLNGTNTTIVDNLDNSYTINSSNSGISNVASTDNSVAVAVSNQVANISIVGKTIQSLAIGASGTTRTGALKFIAGSNVTITDNGDSTFTFNATGGGTSYQSSFSTNVTTGEVPLVVNCTDTTQERTGETPTGWAWSVIGGTSSDYSFTNSTTATSQNPQITFNASSAGNTYQIRLLASGSVTFTAGFKTITPTNTPTVFGDFSLGMTFHTDPATITQPFYVWQTGQFFDVTPSLTTAQTCASVTSSVINSSNTSVPPTWVITATNVNNGFVTDTGAVGQPVFPVTYSATVIAVMNNSDGSTSTKTHTSGNINYYLPAFWRQNQSKLSGLDINSETPQVATTNYVAGQSVVFASGTDIQVVWVGYPKTFTTPPNAYVITAGFPPGLVSRLSDTASIVVFAGISFSVYGYLLGDTGQQTFSSSLYLETPPSIYL